MICKFAYVKTHIVTINKIDYLMFDECEDIYINGYDKKIKFKDLFEYNRNSIMLKDKKVYSSDYKRDYNKKFIKIKRLMNFQIKILIIFIIVIIISFVVFTKLI